jgi:hypothetical protein
LRLFLAKKGWCELRFSSVDGVSRDFPCDYEEQRIVTWGNSQCKDYTGNVIVQEWGESYTEWQDEEEKGKKWVGRDKAGMFMMGLACQPLPFPACHLKSNKIPLTVPAEEWHDLPLTFEGLFWFFV